MLSPLEEADYIICTGLFDDETESADDYRAMLLRRCERKLPMICANPDIVVERGDRLIYCAARSPNSIRELGGEVIFYGKPHRPIYERAMALAAEQIGTRPRSTRCWRSAIRCGLISKAPWFRDRLPVRDPRIHAEDFEGIHELDPASVKELFGDPLGARMRSRGGEGRRLPPLRTGHAAGLSPGHPLR